MVNGNAKEVFQNGQAKVATNGHATSPIATILNGSTSLSEESTLNLFAGAETKTGDICPSCGASAFVY